ncbi:MAG: nucleoside hydrolase [Alphaproteobacteria bacterium]|nr:nucleoside hydrolase [Alphaproteobacteria bacterium]
MQRRKIILDCDPGQDDAVAMLLALASPELDVLGVSTVAGNVPLPLTKQNALVVRELAGPADVPILAGAERPLRRALVTAEEVHGASGLDGVDLPPPHRTVDPRPAAAFIVEQVMAHPPGTVTLVPVGPLTNVAEAMRQEPRLARRLRGIVLMGGAIGVGNTTPAAEFNIFVDPEAAAIVFASGADLTMLPLDATHQAITTDERIAAIRALGTRVGRVVASWLAFYRRHDMDRYGMPGGPLHDPCAVAYVLWPELFSGRFCHVAIETEGKLTLGRTVVDWWPNKAKPSGAEPNCMVIDRIDADAFFRRLTERLGRL